ncbi:MAG: outer membrane beta-barrel protein [Pseudomonadota bacterium]
MKKILLCLLLTVGAVSADDTGFYLYGDIGIADTDFATGPMVGLGGGFQITEFVGVELGYNNFGETGPFDIDISSVSFAATFGTTLSNGTFIHGIVGFEELEADGRVNVGFGSINIDGSSNEPLFGIGARFGGDGSTSFRTRLISHDSGDLLTLTAGVEYRF